MFVDGAILFTIGVLLILRGQHPRFQNGMAFIIIYTGVALMAASIIAALFHGCKNFSC